MECKDVSRFATARISKLFPDTRKTHTHTEIFICVRMCVSLWFELNFATHTHTHTHAREETHPVCTHTYGEFSCRQQKVPKMVERGRWWGSGWLAVAKDIDLDGRRNGTFLLAPLYMWSCVFRMAGGGVNIFHLCPMSFVPLPIRRPPPTPRSTLFWEVLLQSFVVFEKGEVHTHICMY